jgi:hypothetical protein
LASSASSTRSPTACRIRCGRGTVNAAAASWPALRAEPHANAAIFTSTCK